MAKGGRRSTSWKRGVSGNPLGRPKRLETIEARKVIEDIKAAARESTAEALAVLRDVMNDCKAPPSARVGAATAILDRGWGRPMQAVEAKHDWTFAEIVARSLKITVEPPAYLGEITTPEMLRLESQGKIEDCPGSDNCGWEG